MKAQAGDKAKTDAEAFWRQKLQGPKLALVLPATSAEATTVWGSVSALAPVGIYWQGGSFEGEEAQLDFTTKMFEVISARLQNQLHIKVLDSHQKGMRDPPCRPDLTMTKVQYGYTEDSNIPWTEVVCAGECKRLRSELPEAQMQFTEWAWETLQQQPDRTCVFGLMLTGINISFIRMQRNGDISCSQPVPYLVRNVADPPEGFRQLVNFL